MNAEEQQQAQAELSDIPHGWTMIARYEVASVIYLEFGQAGMFGQQITVMGATFDEAMQRASVRIRKHQECYRNRLNEKSAG
jgi:hypothetical protein